MREAAALASTCVVGMSHVGMSHVGTSRVGTRRVGIAGALAHAALAQSGGRTRPVPGFEATGFRLAAGELIWVGHAAPLHPRVALVDVGDAGAAIDRLAIDGGAAIDRLAIDTAHIHAPRALPELRQTRVDAARAASIAVLRLIGAYEPGGFATLLVGGCPAFPLSLRADAALALAAACAENDAGGFAAAATRLLGAGSGLTPSGDDYVGGALFARRLAGMDERWSGAVRDIVALAPARTHAISAALLGDLACGSSYAALHGVAEAIAVSGDDTRTWAMDAHMRALAGIGHSSGWDMLAGFIAGLAGTLDLRRS